jgi:hypothetical protein
MKWYDAGLSGPDASAGRDLLGASGMGIRPRIGGSRRKRGVSKQRTWQKRATHRSKGGFTPSVMGGFVQNASRFITPLVLFAGYKLMTNRTHKRRR